MLQLPDGGKDVTYYFNNDIERYTIAPNFTFWKGKLTLGGSIGIQQDNLLNRVSEVGSKLASDSQNLKFTARTSGTSMWIETESPAALVAHMRSQGVVVKQNGDMVVAKPALIMGQNQAGELISALNKFN
mgnify:CR=1 FL=1